MIDRMLEGAALIDGILWGPWTMGFIALAALYFSVRSGFFPFRRAALIWRNTLGGILRQPQPEKRSNITPFQATTTALASTVGMGNMAGVATALSVGGPGAIFWMWVFALLGMMTKTAEITLAVHYRAFDSAGELHGGPMHYMRRGLGWPLLAGLFSAGVLINALFTATLIQSHTVGRAFWTSYGLSPYLTTGIMAGLTGFVIIGGIRRIGKACERLVPLMSLVYLTGGMLVFLINADKIPEVFGLIVRHAFAPAPAAGGFAGAAFAAAVKQGMSRGMLSNEAGLGTAPMVHAVAATPHPFRQGMWGSVEVFIDTLIICTITSFAILSTGVLGSGESGIELVIAGFAAELPGGLARGLISFAVLTFCLTTQIGFFVYYETAATDLFGRRVMPFLRWFYLIPGVVFAGVADVDRLWIFANISVGVCALPNLFAVLTLSGAFFTLMGDFLSGENRYATDLVDRRGKHVRSASSR